MGNAAEWATVVIAAVALFFAAMAWRASKGMLDLEQKRENRAEDREAERRLADEQAVQADLVAAWVTTDLVSLLGAPSAGVSPFAEAVMSAKRKVIAFLNSSPLPVYATKLELQQGGETLATMDVGVLPPGPTTRSAPQVKPAGSVEIVDEEGNVGSRQLRVEDLELVLTFTDVAGREWTRHADGRIIKKPYAKGRLRMPAAIGRLRVEDASDSD